MGNAVKSPEEYCPVCGVYVGLQARKSDVKDSLIPFLGIPAKAYVKHVCDEEALRGVNTQVARVGRERLGVGDGATFSDKLKIAELMGNMER